MIIIGDSLIPFEEIYKISKIEDIKDTKANSLLLFYYDEELVKYCFENKLKYALLVENIKESLYANALDAKYIICKKSLAKKIQKIADNYIFDSKILALIKTSDELEEIALNEIDGAIYKELI